jgi:isopenicillin N synthase-like dioxygenase
MLPILDISPYLQNPHSPGARDFVTAVRETCHGPGFFHLVGHGVPDQLDIGIMAVARQFFALPEAQRHEIAIGNSPHFRGYTVLGDEITAGRNDWRDQLDVGPEEPALAPGPDDPPWLRLRGPNQWPAGLPEMQGIVVAWMAAIEPLALALIRALALGLGQPAGYFDPAMAPDPYTRVKIVRYPALPPGAQHGQGLGLHHDSGLFTFILQDAVPGLEIEKDGRLMKIEPMPGAYVVNLGEMFQAASNGYLRATKHRVVSPPPGRERISIAYFMNPRLDAVFESIDLPPQLAKQAPGAQNADPQDPVHRTFGDNTLKTRMRAHPDVVAKFYQDVR